MILDLHPVCGVRKWRGKVSWAGAGAGAGCGLPGAGGPGDGGGEGPLPGEADLRPPRHRRRAAAGLRSTQVMFYFRYFSIVLAVVFTIL